MSNDRRTYLVAYDVPSDPRRTRLAHVLQSYGDRIQYSVFLVDCSSSRIVKLRQRLIDTMDQKEDSILICHLGLAAKSHSSMETLGLERPVTPRGFIIA